MKKEKCNKCRNKAVWCYLPNEDVGFFCEIHVPRSCSCQLVLKKDVQEILSRDGEILNPDSDFEPAKDELGRDLPCCEYHFNSEGFDQDFPKEDKYEEFETDFWKKS